VTVIATLALEGGYDLDANLEAHLAHIAAAADAGADLVVFPEISLHGYPSAILGSYPEQDLLTAYEVAEELPTGPRVRQLVEAARERGIHVVFGLHERGTSPGVVYNTLVLTGPDGYVGSYRKVHVGITEQLLWRRGDDWPVFETAIGRIGMMICYDKMWPESGRELMLRGADILVASSAWPMVNGGDDADDNVWVDNCQLYDRVRSAENARWLVSSNYAGEMGGAAYVGQSQVVDPSGRVVARTEPLVPGMAVAEIDVAGGIGAVQAGTFGARLVRDRRQETYRASSGELAWAVDG
jgi:predicted amidohydrolase